ncbi:MAG: hypothetical protein AAF754_02900 [Pseudomonadota bacterium]
MNIPADHALVPVDGPIPKDHKINWIAFFAAFILAPLVPALLTLPTLATGPGALIFAIAAGSVVFGALPYLVIGMSCLIDILQEHGNDSRRIVKTAFKATAIIVLLIGALMAVTGNLDLGGAAFFGTCALVFGPLWASIFSALYARFDRAADNKGV